MAMSDPTGSAFARAMTAEMLAAQKDFNRDWAKMLEYVQQHPLPSPTRWQKAKSRVWWWQYDLRSCIGRWIAP